MDHFEKVEKLREKANVSYDEAKAALEATNWDLLDAMVLLERQGKVKQNIANFTTQKEPPKEEPDAPEEEKCSFGEVVGRFFRWVGKIIQKGNENYFNVTKKEEKIISIPVKVFVLLLFFMFWIIVPLVIIGLFCGYGYSFQGPHLGKKQVNDVMEKASTVANDIKKDISNELKKD